MERRRAVALILGLVVCLALLGRWAMHPDEQGDASVQRKAAIEQPAPSALSAAKPADATESAPATAPEATQDKADSGAFRGRIINAVTRQPVREFQLEFHPARPTRDSPKPPFHSFNTKDGRFEAPGVPAGIWTIYATARGYQRFELPDVTISSGKAAREILIPMRPGYALSGRVFDESTDEGIAGANISFREAHVGRWEGNFRNRPSTTSQKGGTFALDGLPTGQVVVTVHAENYGSKDLDITVGNKMAPVEIGLSAGSIIAGYLAGADGLTPVTGFVSLNNLDQSSGVSMPSGPAGEFSFKRLSPARYRLAGRGGGLSGTIEITLADNEQLEGIVLAMRGGHSIRGVISGLRPEDIASATVSILREGDFGVIEPAQVDARGAYTLPGVLPGKVHVIANARSRRQVTRTVEMPADTDLKVDLDFPQGARLTGRVTRGGKPLGGIEVSPSSEPWSSDQNFFMDEVRTSASGDYLFEDVPDGQYTLRVDSYRSPIVRVSGDTVFDVDVPAAQLAGRLLEDGGKVPVVGATVYIWPAQPGASQNRTSAQSDHFGQFALRGLQPGDYVLSVYKPGYELYRGPLAFGAPVSNMTINLRPARGVEIKVRDAMSGRAVSSLMAVETVNGQRGLMMQLNLDQNGVGFLPSAIAGSTLKFSALGYAPAEVVAWNGEGFEMSLQPDSSR